MFKYNKTVENILSVRFFLLLMMIVSFVSVTLISVNSGIKQKEKEKLISKNIEDAKEKKDNNEKGISEDNLGNDSEYYKEYRMLPSVLGLCSDMNCTTNVSNALSKAQINDSDKLEGIVLGADIDGKGIERYYFEDKEIIEVVLDKINQMEFIKMTNIGEDKYMVEPDWDIQLYRVDSEYALRLYGEPTNENNCFRTKVDEVFEDGYHTEKDIVDDDYCSVFGSSKQLLFDEDIVDFISSIIENNIDEISVDTVIETCIGDEVDLGEIFKYKHCAPLYTTDLTYGEMLATVFKFPIAETKCYLLIQKEFYTKNNKPANEIERIELYNEEGKYIDILNVTENDIRKFVE